MAKAVETWRGVAYPWNCDSMGHFNTQFYVAAFDGATVHFLHMLRSVKALEAEGLGWADVRQNIEYKHEIQAGTPLYVRTVPVRLGNKSVEFLHELRSAGDDVLRATAAMTTAFFDLKARKALAIPDAIRAKAQTLLDAS